MKDLMKTKSELDEKRNKFRAFYSAKELDNVKQDTDNKEIVNTLLTMNYLRFTKFISDSIKKQEKKKDDEQKRDEEDEMEDDDEDKDNEEQKNHEADGNKDGRDNRKDLQNLIDPIDIQVNLGKQQKQSSH